MPATAAADGIDLHRELTDREREWRSEVRDFLDRELPPEYECDLEFTEDEATWAFALQFTRKVGERGWIGLTWPTEYGGLARTPIDRMVMMEEFTYRSAPLVNIIGWQLAAGTLLAAGTDEQKRRFLPAIARMETFWAEGLSEPDAGSDLARIRTRADRDGDHWVVNGQKTYTTWGSRADVLYALVRTEPGSERHRGLSVLCIDLRAPGVSFGPLHNVAGGRQNHTFFEDVRVPADMLLGQPGQGWGYVMGTFYSGNRDAIATGIRAPHAHMQRQLDEVVRYCRQARRHGRLLFDDPVVRDKLAELRLHVETQRLLSYENLANALADRPGAYGGALERVVHKETKPVFSELILDIVGPGAELRASTPRAPLGGLAQQWWLESFANHAGGTSQVKRLVLATRGLGLPRGR